MKWADRLQAIDDLIEYAQTMLHYDDRLDSFQGKWAFSPTETCNPAALAAAGWFHYPSSGATEAHCFSSLKVLDFEENDDPMEEQMKRKKGHVFFGRRWAPKIECLSLTSENMVLEEAVRIGQLQSEGLDKYRIDATKEALEEHADQLREKNEQRLARAGLDQTNIDRSGDIDKFETEVMSEIREMEAELTKLKRENTTRFKQANIFTATEMDEADAAVAFKNKTTPVIDALEHFQTNIQQHVPMQAKHKGTRASMAVGIGKSAPPSTLKKQ